MHARPFFFYLEMETIIVPISCRVVVSPKLLRSVKHLGAIRVFCFSTTGKHPAQQMVFSPKHPLYLGENQRRCPATEPGQPAQPSQNMPTGVPWFYIIFQKSFIFHRPLHDTILNYFISGVSEGKRGLRSWRYSVVLSWEVTDAIGFQRTIWGGKSSPASLYSLGNCSEEPRALPSRLPPHLCWTCN